MSTIPACSIHDSTPRIVRSPQISQNVNDDIFSIASAAIRQSLLSASLPQDTNHETEQHTSQQVNCNNINVAGNSIGDIGSQSYMGTCLKTAPISPQHKCELFLPNDLIGCIIGRGGNKINEIRQASQANIKISNGEDGTTDRRITITGSPNSVQMAQNIINNSIDLHKHLLALNLAINNLHETDTVAMPHTYNANRYDVPQVAHFEACPFGNPVQLEDISNVMQMLSKPDYQETNKRFATARMPDSIQPRLDRETIPHRTPEPKLPTSDMVFGEQQSPYEDKREFQNMEKYILDLIGQLPAEQRTKWLNVFEVNNFLHGNTQ